MIKQKKGVGFTLIELLVVITIIGILATGGISVYTSQLQKARDSSRITSVKNIQSSIEQYNQDKQEYPSSNSNLKTLSGYTTIPSDPNTGKACFGNTPCDFLYAVGALNSITNGAYEISTAFENSKTVDTNANDSKDLGNDGIRFELGNDLKTLNTSSSSGPITNSGCTTTTPFKINADCNN